MQGGRQTKLIGKNLMNRLGDKATGAIPAHREEERSDECQDSCPEKRRCNRADAAL